MTHEWDVPLFEVPPRYRPPKRQQEWPIWRHYKGSRISCDDCIRAIAAGRLKWVATPAAYVRTDASGRTFLCHQHAQLRREAET